MYKEGNDVLDQSSCYKDHSHRITFKIFLKPMKFHINFYVYAYMYISLKRRSIDFVGFSKRSVISKKGKTLL